MNLEKRISNMTQQEKDKMFLDLNSVLVKFWKEQGRPDKEVKIELLERMLNWHKKMGTITLDKQSKEPVSKDLEEAAVNGADELLAMPKDYVLAAKADYWNGAYDGFIVGAGWQKEQDESRRMANIKLANTDVPVDTDMEIAFNDIWQDCEVRVERDGNLDEKTTEAMKALCHDFFESGKEWQKERNTIRTRYKTRLDCYEQGRQDMREEMLKDAMEGTYNTADWGVPCIDLNMPLDLERFDKVKIVIVKEDKK